MVANKCSGRANSLLIDMLAGESSSNSCNSSGDREKQAISEAETNAETHKNNPANIIAKIAPPEGGVISMTEQKADKYESGSKK